MDVDSCVSCGRCDEVCPAYMADKDYFSPGSSSPASKKSLDEFDHRREYEWRQAGRTGDIVGKAFARSSSGIAALAAPA